MDYRLILVVASIILSSGLLIAAPSEDKAFKCEFVNNSPSEIDPCMLNSSCSIAYYAIGNNDSDDKLINAKVGLTSPNTNGINYSYALKCESDLSLEFNFDYKTGLNRCEESQFEFGFLNKEHNSKISVEYDEDIYNNSICLNVESSDYGSLDIRIEDETNSNLDAIGFDCMYRFSSDLVDSGNNSKVSSCDAHFTNSLDVISQYPFLVYARLTPNIESSTCNQDCTSTVDGRIYQECGNTIESCESVPLQCDGSLKGEWVKFDSNQDILCKKNFDQYRSTSRSNSSLEVSSKKNECDSITVEKYSVQIDGEAVTMNIYVCEGGN